MSLSHADSLFRRCLSDSPALLPALLSCLHDASALRHRALRSLLLPRQPHPGGRVRRRLRSPSERGFGLERSVEIIGVLAKCKEGREQMVRFGECVQILAGVLRNGSSRGVRMIMPRSRGIPHV
ncbi:uncharacterized protein LOC124826683 [Vigna umbellata]|uniref:uncharacterized protein LOC124826683 n=1 Tax=Vigna umbellata TaxID=87088 RepID=UPI001F5F1591|nr:uncharacterized protein LOC124826683 [Vigna umbellata]